MRLLKKYAGYIILCSIELISFFYMKPDNLEIFFMGWGLFFFALLIYNVFNVFVDGSMGAVDGSLTGGAGKHSLEMKLAESLYTENRNDKRAGGGFLDPSNLIFIVLTIVNVVGYLIIMPK